MDALSKVKRVSKAKESNKRAVLWPTTYPVTAPSPSGQPLPVHWGLAWPRPPGLRMRRRKPANRWTNQREGGPVRKCPALEAGWSVRSPSPGMGGPLATVGRTGVQRHALLRQLLDAPAGRFSGPLDEQVASLAATTLPASVHCPEVNLCLVLTAFYYRCSAALRKGH